MGRDWRRFHIPPTCGASSSTTFRASGYPTPEAVVAAWLNSPGHRANIHNCEARAIGLGVAESADGTRYWTLVFGSVA